jgi:hypothetical protein
MSNLDEGGEGEDTTGGRDIDEAGRDASMSELDAIMTLRQSIVV